MRSARNRDVEVAIRYFNEELTEAFEALGIDPHYEPELIWIAEMALMVPIPFPWSAVTIDVDGSTTQLFHNRDTGITSRTHPLWLRLREMVTRRRTADRRLMMQGDDRISWRLRSLADEHIMVQQQCMDDARLSMQAHQMARRASSRVTTCRRRAKAQLNESSRILSRWQDQVHERLVRLRAFRHEIYTAASSPIYRIEGDEYLFLIDQHDRALTLVDQEIANRRQVKQTQASLRLIADRTDQTIRSAALAGDEARTWLQRVADEMRFIDQQVGRRRRMQFDSRVRMSTRLVNSQRRHRSDIVRLQKGSRDLKRLAKAMAEDLLRSESRLARATEDPIVQAARLDQVIVLDRNIYRIQVESDRSSQQMLRMKAADDMSINQLNRSAGKGHCRRIIEPTKSGRR